MKRTIIITCCSFTAIMLLYELFIAIGMEDMAPVMTRATAPQTFLLSLTIALVMYIYDKIVDRLDVFSFLPDVIIRVLICYCVVFGEGVLFGMFLFSWKSIIQITPVLILTFIITYLLCYLTCVEFAREINRNIKNKKE